VTAEDLQALLDAGDAEGCIRLFANASEAERRAVAKTAADQLAALTADSPDGLTYAPRAASDLNAEAIARWRVLQPRRVRAGQVAVLATATSRELKKFGQRCLPSAEDAIAVLSARRPSWVGEWAEAILTSARLDSGSAAGVCLWSLVRALIREGFCARPAGSRYFHAFIAGVSACSFEQERTIRDLLVEDPALLDDEVWRIFETELPLGLQGNFSTDRYADAEQGWDAALAQLAAEGRLSRTRLLDASLGALERDDRDSRVRWFIRIHERLEPTSQELAERVERYLGLFASRNPVVVNFAMRVIGALDSADQLPPAGLVAGIRPALLSRTKSTVLAALKMLDRAAHRDSSSRGRAAAVAIEAFAHESPAVHKAVVDFLERHNDAADATITVLLRERIETVAASQRSRVLAWLGNASSTGTAEPRDTAIRELLARGSAIDLLLADQAGVSAALDAVARDCGDLAAIQLLEKDVPRLDPRQAIVPISDIDELIGLYLMILENPDNPDEIERVLDGVSRLCDRVPEDFLLLTGPLRARAEAGNTIEWADDVSIKSLATPLCGLALGWITGEIPRVILSTLRGCFLGFFARRVLAITHRAANRVAAPLLSAPTHRGGWLDPRALVERIDVWKALDLAVDPLDGSLALLRLAPDRAQRAEALHNAARLDGPYAAAVRHALGAEGEIAGPDARIWVAAARSRAPLEDDVLVEAHHPGLGPDASRAARCSLRPGPHAFVDLIDRFHRTVIAREPEQPTGEIADLATVLIHTIKMFSASDESRWLATVWPLGRESFFATAAELLLGFECAPRDAPIYRPLLEPLLDPDVPLRSMGRLLLVGALSSNQAELQGLAVDALIAAIEDGRFDGVLLGESIHRLLTEGLLKPTRLAKALSGATQISPLHARVVAHAIQHAVAGLASAPKDLHALLELLKELLVETGNGLSVAGVEDVLRGFRGSGKTAKIASDLLGLTVDRTSQSRSAAAARALAGRIARAERWARCHR
jgi:hypothetical protein